MSAPVTLQQLTDQLDALEQQAAVEIAEAGTRSCHRMPLMEGGQMVKNGVGRMGSGEFLGKCWKTIGKAKEKY